MSKSPEGPHERLVGRLRELSNAVTQGRDAVRREFTMRVPAEPERDADLVLSTAAAELDRLRAENEALREALRKTVGRIKRSATALDWESIDQLEALLTPNAALCGPSQE